MTVLTGKCFVKSRMFVDTWTKFDKFRYEGRHLRDLSVYVVFESVVDSPTTTEELISTGVPTKLSVSAREKSRGVLRPVKYRPFHVTAKLVNGREWRISSSYLGREDFKFCDDLVAMVRNAAHEFSKEEVKIEDLRIVELKET